MLHHTQATIAEPEFPSDLLPDIHSTLYMLQENNKTVLKTEDDKNMSPTSAILALLPTQQALEYLVKAEERGADISAGLNHLARQESYHLSVIGSAVIQ